MYKSGFSYVVKMKTASHLTNKDESTHPDQYCFFCLLSVMVRWQDNGEVMYRPH